MVRVKRWPTCKKTSPHSFLMTGQIEISARAGASSLVAAGPGRGCAGRRDLG